MPVRLLVVAKGHFPGGLLASLRLTGALVGLLLAGVLVAATGCSLLSQGAKSCRAHVDCPVDQVCGDDGRCQLGALDPYVPPTTCSVATEVEICGEGSYCSAGDCLALPRCETADCPAGLHCWSDDQCRRTAPLQCETDEACNADGEFCLGVRTCDPESHTCSPEVNPCPEEAPHCDEELDTCHLCIEDAECPDDENWCNGIEVCLDHKCLSVEPPCADPTPFCDAAAEACHECATGADCPDDGLYCNGVASCSFGSCTISSTALCSGTTPTCVEGAAPVDGGVVDDTDGGAGDAGVAEAPYHCIACRADGDCNDGLWCTGDETCVDETCLASTVERCPGQNCLESTDTCGDCLSDADCNDGLWCTGSETCVGGACIDGTNPCDDNQAFPFCNETLDACRECNETDDCWNHPDRPDGSCFTCTDSEKVCEFTETCTNGEYCREFFCADWWCFPFGWHSEEEADTCFPCTAPTAASDCEDGLYCTGEPGTDSCALADESLGGTCQRNPPCDAAHCLENGDCCRECVNSGECNDGQFCNGVEACQSPGSCAANCTSPGDPCLANPVDNKCNETANRCDECLNASHCPQDRPLCSNAGECVECFNASDCADEDDGLFCTPAPQCTNNQCVLPPGPQCTGLTPQCDEATNLCKECLNDTHCPGDRPFCNTNGSCRECLNAAHCDNGDYCDGNELCQGGNCQAGTSPCDPGETCVEASNSCIGGGPPDGG